MDFTLIKTTEQKQSSGENETFKYVIDETFEQGTRTNLVMTVYRKQEGQTVYFGVVNIRGGQIYTTFPDSSSTMEHLAVLDEFLNQTEPLA